MVSLVMVMRDVLVDRASQVALAEWNQSMQAFELDGPHEAFCMRVTVRSADGRLDNVDSGRAQEREHRAAPFSIAIANQHRARVQNAVNVIGEMPYGLQHEGFVWMRRGTNVGVASLRRTGTVRRAQRLGGLLNFYHRAA
jgi:hypothetical protein